MAEDLDAAAQAAKPAKTTLGNPPPPPEDGGSYMDDNYMWSASRSHMQRMLNSRLPNISSISVSSQWLSRSKIAGNEVLTKGPHHAFHVLGSPL